MSFTRSTLSASLLIASLLTYNVRALGYTLPNGNDRPISDENVAALQKISKGVSAVAKLADKAVVFVSIYKTVKGLPPGMIDPFEFFFGPNQGRQRQQQQQPRRQERMEGGVGSGFFVDLDKGYIITNNHVIQDADEIQLKMANGQTYEGTIVGRDQNTDIAVVQVKDKNFNRTGLGALPIGNSDDASVGEFVVAVGAPFGLDSSISFGIISATGRGNLQITQMGNFIQTDAAINPGNSGGPLINMSGQVIGMNTAIYSRSGGYAGIGFAVPSNLARRIAEQLINSGKVVRGYIGIALSAVDPELHKSLGLPRDIQGSLVRQVVKGGPADKGGLEPGDVIVSVNKAPVRNDSDVSNGIGLMTPGSNADLAVMRDGKNKNLSIKVAQFPDENQLANSAAKSKEAGDEAYGMALGKLTPQLKQQYEILAKNGLIVTDLEEGSEAARAGIQPGDVIIQVNGKAIGDVASFKSLMKQAGAKAILRIERSGQMFAAVLRTK